MLTPDTEALITHHKVRVDAANNVHTHFVTTGEGSKAERVIHGAPRTWNAFLDLISPPVDAGCRLAIPTTAAPMPEEAPRGKRYEL